jgi:hypothetical protein
VVGDQFKNQLNREMIIMRSKTFRSLSFKVWVCLSAGFCIAFYFYQKSFRGKEFIVSDGYGYYIFLPATFIYHDLTFKYVDELPGDLRRRCWIRSYPGEDFRTSKMSIGTAVCMMPFFLLAHGYAKLFHYPAHGYSQPYQTMIAFAALFYFLAGLYFVRKTLLKFFSEGITVLSMILLAGATTLINYTFNDPSMSHVYSFFAFSLMVWFTVRWHETFSRKHFLWLCFCFGFMALIRLFNVLACLFPLLYGLHDSGIRNEKIKFVREKWKVIVSGAAVFLLTIMPQLVLWKFQTGRWVFDGYEGEHFFLNHPHIFDVLFGFRNGWLIYTPVMIAAVIGIWLSVRQRKNFGIPLLLFFPLMLYILSCWWCWNYGGAFGFRPFVDFYPMFILPAATFMAQVSSKKFSAIIFSALLGLCIWLNIFQQIQYQRGILHYADMTARAYVAIFGKTYYPPGYDTLLEPFDNEMALLGKPLRNMKKFEDFGYIPLKEETVKIKGANGKYLSVDNANNYLLVANSDSAGTAGIFTLIYLNNGRCALKAWNGRYIFSHDSGFERAEMDIVSDNEVFHYIALGENKFALNAVNGCYLQIDHVEPYYLIAKSESVSKAETFELEK